MKLVAEAGATKIQWGIVYKDNVYEFMTSGFNPNVSDRNYLRQLLVSGFPVEYDANTISEIQYFGAGCSSLKNKNEVNRALSNFFTKAFKVEIYSDLEAAGKAIFGNNSGLVGVLGTGSSFGFYENGTIQQQAPSLGYLLGDEGSGAFMGKELLKKILHNELPENIEKIFYKEFNTSSEQLVHNLYQSKTQSAFLAGFARFLKDYNNDIHINTIVIESLESFVDRYVRPMVKNRPESKIGFVGGLAYAFKTEINLIFEQKKILTPVIVEQPFERLVKL